MQNGPQIPDEIPGGAPPGSGPAIPPGGAPPVKPVKKGPPVVLWFILGGGALGCLLLVVLIVVAAVVIPRLARERETEAPPIDQQAVDSFAPPPDSEDDGGGDGDQQYRDQIQSQLLTNGAIYTAQGYSETHSPRIDRLEPDATDSINFELDADVEYVVIGVCDTDCSDLDLRLKDENGNTIDEDFATDDFPTVEVTPSWTGRFDLEVVMAACHEAYCFYGVAIYGRR